MTDDHRAQGNTEHTEIKPADIRLTRAAGGQPAQDQAPRTGTPRWIAPLAILLLVAAGVVFFLPRMISPPVLQTAVEEASPPGSAAAPRAKSPPPEASPFQQAQEARQRARSQEILSQLLKRQEALEAKNVEAWGAESYQGALKLAAEGDAAYRERDFRQAIMSYGEALDALSSLEARMEDLFEEAVADGGQALAAGDSAGARQAFERALLMKPDHAGALKGLERARTLDQVLQLITAGNDLQLNGRLEQARKKYEEALAIDGQAEEARRQIAVVDRKILDRDFNQLMSEGYAHLQAGELERAKSAFGRALKLKPGAGEAVSALDQAGNRMTNRQINDHLARAVDLEKQEKWTEAAAEYGKALALDAALAQAREGKRYADSRVALDQRLQQIISAPDRLTNKAVYEETRQVYQAVDVAGPGPRLDRQLSTVKNMLELARQPVEVTLRSDNQTQVTLYQVGILGKFEETSLTLLPGEYVAVGTREGYRDVRVQFTIEPDHPPTQPVLVSAVEKIAAR